MSVRAEDFIRNAGMRLKQREQSIDNAIEVLRAIIAPDRTEKVHYLDFYRFLAMFGPEDSTMIKIASLLKYSNENGQFLSFAPPPPPEISIRNQNLGYFDPAEPNKLIYRSQNNVSIISWNNPLAQATTPYVIDELDQKHASWEDFFNAKVISHYPSFPFFDYH